MAAKNIIQHKKVFDKFVELKELPFLEYRMLLPMFPELSYEDIFNSLVFLTKHRQLKKISNGKYYLAETAILDEEKWNTQFNYKPMKTKIMETSIIVTSKESQMVKKMSDLLLSYFDFDVKNNIKYDLKKRIYNNAKRITETAHVFNKEEDIKKEQLEKMYEIGLGNINMIVQNFFEQKPDMFVNIETILSCFDFELLKKELNMKKELRNNMIKMEKEWNTLIQEIKELNITGNIKIPFNEDLE